MCFGADASFAGAAVLGGLGVWGITQVRAPRQLPWAVLPLAFAVHQLVEGLTWLELEATGAGAAAGWTVHVWAVFGWALLPLWIPLAVRALEDDPARRRRLRWLVGLGAADAALMGVLAVHSDLRVRVVDGTLDYVLPWGDAGLLALPYVAATCGAALLSGRPWVRAFGVANLLALSVVAVVERQGFSSVWCALAAGLSVLVVAEVRSGVVAPSAAMRWAALRAR